MLFAFAFCSFFFLESVCERTFFSLLDTYIFSMSWNVVNRKGFSLIRILLLILCLFSTYSFADDKTSPFHYERGSKSSKCVAGADDMLHFLMSNDVGDQRGVCNNKCECLGSVLVSSKLVDGYDVTFQCKNSGYSCNEKEDEDKDEGEEDIPTCNHDERLVFDPNTKKYSCEKKEEKCPGGYKEEKGKCVPDLKICHAKPDYNSDKETYGSAQELCQMFADNLNKDTYSSRNHTLKVKDVSQSSCTVGDNVYDHFLDISCDVEPPECDTGYTLDEDTNKCIKDNDKGDDDKGDNDKGDNDKGDNDKGDNDKGDDDKGDDNKGDDNKGDDDKGDDDKEGFCQYAKKLCDFIDDTTKYVDDLIKEDDLKTDDKDTNVEVNDISDEVDDYINKTYLSFSSYCPSNSRISFSFFGVTKTFTLFDWSRFCYNVEHFIRPVVIFLFSLASIYVYKRD